VTCQERWCRGASSGVGEPNLGVLDGGGLTGVARGGGELGRRWSSGEVANRRSSVGLFGLGKIISGQRSLRGEGLAGG
jgi:hypothetical protein